jgi:hypothetical protein
MGGIRSFSTGTRSNPVNHRIAACRDQRATARKTPITVGFANHPLTLFVISVYGRERVPSPAILALIDTETIGTVEYEIECLMMNRNVNPIHQVYRIWLAGLKVAFQLPQTNGRVNNTPDELMQY